MKQLQNNFTTPEQSKILLELGVPADSADCFYNNCTRKHELNIVPPEETFRSWLAYGENYETLKLERYYPCWSVGRLAQIVLICSGSSKVQMWFKNSDTDLIKSFIDDIFLLKESGNLDFSKLED